MQLVHSVYEAHCSHGDSHATHVSPNEYSVAAHAEHKPSEVNSYCKSHISQLSAEEQSAQFDIGHSAQDDSSRIY